MCRGGAEGVCRWQGRPASAAAVAAKANAAAPPFSFCPASPPPRSAPVHERQVGGHVQHQHVSALQVGRRHGAAPRAAARTAAAARAAVAAALDAAAAPQHAAQAELFSERRCHLGRAAWLARREDREEPRPLLAQRDRRAAHVDLLACGHMCEGGLRPSAGASGVQSPQASQARAAGGAQGAACVRTPRTLVRARRHPHGAAADGALERQDARGRGAPHVPHACAQRGCGAGVRGQASSRLCSHHTANTGAPTPTNPRPPLPWRTRVFEVAAPPGHLLQRRAEDAEAAHVLKGGGKHAEGGGVRRPPRWAATARGLRLSPQPHSPTHSTHDIHDPPHTHTQQAKPHRRTTSLWGTMSVNRAMRRASMARPGAL